MTPRLTDEERHAIEARQGKPVEVVDPTSSAVFYLISGEQFDYVRSLLEPEAFDVRETYPAQEQALGAVWSDPALDAYDDMTDPPRRS